MKTLEIITMVYKSQEFLDLICEELTSDYCKSPGYIVTHRYIANDATPEILLGLRGTPHTIYNDPKPDDYYLNRVYRAWNYGAQTSEADNICFVNSDMMFSKNWLTNLLKHHDGINIPCSRLIESGKLLSGQYAISRDFGREPNSLQREEFQNYAESISRNGTPYGGLFMPCIFETKRFLEAGGYPEGNIYADGAGTLNGSVLQSGDDWFFRKLEREYGMKHITVFDSLVYHLQQGEMDS